ncbi:MAG: zinc ribbon domain-containing protein [Armatimonadetes bacterium]|nr:zinc ribbon domain-containing protein [Armatimonadota bacterium]
MTDDRKRCTFCGAENLPAAAFCGQCGRGFGAPAPSRATLVVGIFLALIAGAAACFLVMRAVDAPAGPASKVQAGVALPAPEPPSGAQAEGEPAEAEAPQEEQAVAAVEEGEAVGSAEAATDLVMQQPEVQEWLRLIEEAQAEGKQRRALVEVTEETETAYIVRVFESVEDEEPGHVATFGWYNVSKTDGAISDANPP